MTEPRQLVIIGAGPAGFSAATEAAALGLDVLLLDEQPRPGGQIYRGVTETPEKRADLLGKDFQRGGQLVKDFLSSGAEYWPGTSVWSLNGERQIGIVRDGKASRLQAERIIIAGGAMERPVPFPGWTLPGVMNAGAAQILLKTAGVVPQDGLVIAGSGPLLLLLAWQYLRAGVQVRAVLEMAPFANLLRATPRLPRALSAGNYLFRGMRYTWDLKRAGVPIHYWVSDLRAEGSDKVEAVSFHNNAAWSRGKQTIPTDNLLIHFGVIPRLNLTRNAGCEHKWSTGQQCWRPRLDRWGNTTVSGIAVAGDSASITGAWGAERSGRLCAREAAHKLDLITAEKRDQLSRADQQWLRVDRRVRPFLETLHQLPSSALVAADDSTTICRCEEITAGDIRRAVRDGHETPDQVKAFLRCGMGPCQGRQCASSVARIVAAESGQSVADFPAFRVRPPIRPLTIEQLAGFDESNS